MKNLKYGETLLNDVMITSSALLFMMMAFLCASASRDCILCSFFLLSFFSCETCLVCLASSCFLLQREREREIGPHPLQTTPTHLHIDHTHYHSRLTERPRPSFGWGVWLLPSSSPGDQPSVSSAHSHSGPGNGNNQKHKIQIKWCSIIPIPLPRREQLSGLFVVLRACFAGLVCAHERSQTFWTAEHPQFKILDQPL